ncbi:MAG: ABC transporter permease [Chloroflexi bacterium]|nr:ABC transporter permease [Chloroflexota bacterium]
MEQRSLWRDAMRRLMRNRMALFGLTVAFLLVITAIFGPMLTPYDFTATDLTITSQPPSLQHWLGTDPVGRDFLSRIMMGARTALLVAILTTFFSNTIGIVLGGLAAFRGGWVDISVMRLAEVFMAFPSLLLAAFVNASMKRPTAQIFGNLSQATGMKWLADTTVIDMLVVFGALSIAAWPWSARLIRGQILSLREELYVTAAQAVGTTDWGILRRHLIPNALGPIIVRITIGFGGAMLAESSLSFLGIGVQPPAASWGKMINDALTGWRSYPHLVIVPGMVLAVVVFAFNMLGDGLNDALNPRSRGK